MCLIGCLGSENTTKKTTTEKTTELLYGLNAVKVFYTSVYSCVSIHTH